MIRPSKKLIVHDFPNGIKIIPIGDVHFGASACQLDLFKSVLKQIKEEPNTYCVLVGDLYDNAIIAGKNLGIFDATMTPTECRDKMVALLEPIKDKILGAVPGNHENRSEGICDGNLMYDTMCILGLDHLYRPEYAVLKIRCGSVKNKQKNRRFTFTIILHHGTGTSTSAFKKDYDYLVGFEGADAIITGHTHWQQVGNPARYSINHKANEVVIRSLSVIIINSFVSTASYAAKKMLPPSGTTTTYCILDNSKHDKSIITVTHS